MAVRLLLTRPAERGAALLAQCRAAGFAVEHQPLQVLQTLAPPTISAEPMPQAVIVVSVTAAELGAPLLPAAWKNHTILIAVGKATAQVLRQAGWPAALVPAQENSEALLQLPPMQHLAQQRVVLLRGESGRELISETLTQRGAALDTIVLYRSVAPGDEIGAAIAQWAQQPGAIVLSSTQALQQLCAIIPPAQRARLHLLCLGPRIAQAAQTHFSQVSVISALSLEAIKQAL